MIRKSTIMTIRMTALLTDKFPIGPSLERRSTTLRMDIGTMVNMVGMVKSIINTDVESHTITKKMETICGSCTLSGKLGCACLMHQLGVTGVNYSLDGLWLGSKFC